MFCAKIETMDGYAGFVINTVQIAYDPSLANEKIQTSVIKAQVATSKDDDARSILPEAP